MNELKVKPIVGVMGSAQEALDSEDAGRSMLLAELLGKAIADRECVLVTGATTGTPNIVSRAARSHGGLTIGISPAASSEEHVCDYSLPVGAADVIIYTGFGLKGRNVVNVRSCDIVIIFGGGIGTLNEFTIAYDEGKILGVLEGTGGVADRVKDLASLSGKRDPSEIVFESNPEALIEKCLSALAKRD
jgi:uncharacterized protein (TIGR00725 family)